MKAYAEVRKQLASQHDAADDLLSCRYCNEPTPWSVLSRCGARCEVCFGQFLRVGYSGATPPPAIKQAYWVKGEAERVRRHIAARGAPPNAFSALSQRMQARKARREAIRGLSDDDVNAMIEGAR